MRRYTPRDVPIEVLTPVDGWSTSGIRPNTDCSPFTYSGECPGPFSKRTTGCYLSSAEVMGKDNARAKMSYEDGKAWCEKYGMHMVAPICETENDESVNMIQTDRAWLGAYNANGSWKSSYTDKPLTYTNWDPPLNSKHAFIDPADGSWKDAASVNESEVVCVKDTGSIDIVNAQPDDTYTGMCAPPFQRGPYGCYMFSSDEPAVAEFMENEYDRNDAIALCEAVNSKLATPRNEVENDYFRSKLDADRPWMNLGAQFNKNDLTDRSLYEYDIEQNPSVLAYSKYDGDRSQIDVSLDRDGGWYGGSTSTPVFMCLAHTDGSFQMSPNYFDTSRFEVFKKSDIVTLAFPSKNQVLFDTSTNAVYADAAQKISFNFRDYPDIEVFGITYVASGITPGVNIPSVYDDDTRSPRAWDLSGLKLDENGISLKFLSMFKASPVVNVNIPSQSSRLDVGSILPIWGYPWSEHEFTYSGVTNHSSDKQSDLMSTYPYVVIDMLVYGKETQKNGGIYYRHGYANELNDPSTITWVGGTFRTNDGHFFDVSDVTNTTTNFRLNNLFGEWFDANKHRLTIRGFRDAEWVDTNTDADYATSRARMAAFKTIAALRIAVDTTKGAMDAIPMWLLKLKEYYDIVQAGTYTYVQLIRMQVDAQPLRDQIVGSADLIDLNSLKQQYNAIDKDSLSSELSTMLNNLYSSITSFDSELDDDKVTATTYNTTIQAAIAPTPEPHNFGVFQMGETLKLSFPQAAEILLSTNTSGAPKQAIDLNFTDYPDTDVFGITYIASGFTSGLTYDGFNDKVNTLCQGHDCATRSPPSIHLGGLSFYSIFGYTGRQGLQMRFQDDPKEYPYFDVPYDPWRNDVFIPLDQATWGIHYSPHGYTYLGDESTTHSTDTQTNLFEKYTYAVIEILIHGGSRDRNGGVYYRHGYTNNINDPKSDEIVYVGGTFRNTDSSYFSRSERVHSNFNDGVLANKVFRMANLKTEPESEWDYGSGTRDGTTLIPQRKLIVRGFPKLNNPQDGTPMWTEPELREYNSLRATLDLHIRLNHAKSYFEGADRYLKLIQESADDVKRFYDGNYNYSDAEREFESIGLKKTVTVSARKALYDALIELRDIPISNVDSKIRNIASAYKQKVVPEWNKFVETLRDANSTIQQYREKKGKAAFAVDREKETLQRCDGDDDTECCNVENCNDLLHSSLMGQSMPWYNEKGEYQTTGSCGYCPARYYHFYDDYYTDDNAYTAQVGDGEKLDILGWTPEQVYEHIRVVAPPKEHTFDPTTGPSLSCKNGWKSAGGKWYCELDGTYYFHSAASRCESLSSVLPAAAIDQSGHWISAHSDSRSVRKALCEYARPPQPPEYYCPSGWEEFDDSWYCAFSNYKGRTFSYVDAQSICARLHSSILPPQNKEEDDFLNTMINSRKWVGLEKGYNKYGNNIWVSTQGTEQTWKNFEQNEVRPWHDCMITLDPNSSSKWGSTGCSSKNNFICKYHPDLANEAPKQHLNFCRNGWNQINGKWYCQKDCAWNCQKYCEEISSIAAVPRSADDVTAIHSEYGSFWIGLTQAADGTWKDDDGADLTYTNWQSGHPKSGTNYYQAYIDSSKKWYTYSDSDRVKTIPSTICEYKFAPKPLEPLPSPPEWSPPKECGMVWREMNGKYYCPREIPLAPYDANSDCIAKLDSRLAVPTNSEENEFINDMFDGETMIGISDEEKEGTWTSDVDGSEISWSNWRPGRPNNYNNEDFGFMYNDGKWDDTWWSTRHPYVCQYVPPPSTPQPTHSCPGGWRGAHEKWYCPFTDTKTKWADAKSACENLDSTLAVPTNRAENNYLHGLSGGSTWLGISDAQNEGQWVSDIDGSPLSWTNWYQGSFGNIQPEGGNGHNYARLRDFRGWYDDDGIRWGGTRYICQAK